MQAVFKGEHILLLPFGPSGAGKTGSVLERPDSIAQKSLDLIASRCETLNADLREGHRRWRANICAIEEYNGYMYDLLEEGQRQITELLANRDRYKKKKWFASLLEMERFYDGPLWQPEAAKLQRSSGYPGLIVTDCAYLGYPMLDFVTHVARHASTPTANNTSGSSRSNLMFQIVVELIEVDNTGLAERGVILQRGSITFIDLMGLEEYDPKDENSVKSQRTGLNRVLQATQSLVLGPARSRKPLDAWKSEVNSHPVCRTSLSLKQSPMYS
jgi:hypothetical protein